MGALSLRAAFPDGIFGAPATDADLARAEAELGVTIPAVLKALYREADGFREPLGNTSYLTPLSELVSGTQFMWSEFAESPPHLEYPDFKPFVFFGATCAGGWWGIRCEAPNDVISWHHHMLEEGGYDLAGIDIISAYLADFDHLQRIVLKDA